MKASELLAKVKAGESIPCDTCKDEIPADEIRRIVFRRGEFAPKNGKREC